ncbi:TlpA family protein disulfide reductase [Rubrivirga litoralis]|uniref:Thioredoxin n=1 Tax=Rubrivirga litoralis TaxID=3075598 RepID=A0ABU3BU14_9BACT|nr:thioredoxin [Rubrivirga sp. F394]MDT0632770.1 thioredoxin [Rubrivirga sp. F394]
MTDDSTTAADAALRETIQSEGVHVVHVWAPWCDNSLNELAPVWAGVVPGRAASVTHVAVWSDGDDGADVLREYDVEVGGRGGAVLAVPGPKPAPPERRLTLLGLPVTWIPTTWVFNRGGLLATAFNYGEVSADALAAAIDGAGRSW